MRWVQSLTRPFSTVFVSNSKYYFNLETNTVEKGLVSDWTHRMGPYETEEVALAALEKARERNQQWDEDDEKWNG